MAKVNSASTTIQSGSATRSWTSSLVLYDILLEEPMKWPLTEGLTSVGFSPECDVVIPMEKFDRLELDDRNRRGRDAGNLTTLLIQASADANSWKVRTACSQAAENCYLEHIPRSRSCLPDSAEICDEDKEGGYDERSQRRQVSKIRQGGDVLMLDENEASAFRVTWRVPTCTDAEGSLDAFHLTLRFQIMRNNKDDVVQAKKDHSLGNFDKLPYPIRDFLIGNIAECLLEPSELMDTLMLASPAFHQHLASNVRLSSVAVSPNCSDSLRMAHFAKPGAVKRLAWTNSSSSNSSAVLAIWHELAKGCINLKEVSVDDLKVLRNLQLPRKLRTLDVSVLRGNPGKTDPWTTLTALNLPEGVTELSVSGFSVQLPPDIPNLRDKFPNLERLSISCAKESESNVRNSQALLPPEVARKLRVLVLKAVPSDAELPNISAMAALCSLKFYLLAPADHRHEIRLDRFLPVTQLLNLTTFVLDGEGCFVDSARGDFMAALAHTLPNLRDLSLGCGDFNDAHLKGAARRLATLRSLQLTKGSVSLRGILDHLALMPKSFRYLKVRSRNVKDLTMDVAQFRRVVGSRAHVHWDRHYSWNAWPTWSRCLSGFTFHFWNVPSAEKRDFETKLSWAMS